MGGPPNAELKVLEGTDEDVKEFVELPYVVADERDEGPDCIE